MEISDKGVIRQTSFMDFAVPSEFARKALYYISIFGHYYCSPNYHIARDGMDLFLLMYVRSGKFFAKNRGLTATATAGEILLVDCRSAHEYGCLEKGDFLWFHFNGKSCGDYVDYLMERHGLIYRGEQIRTMEATFENILKLAQYAMTGEATLSHRVDRILTALATVEKFETPVNPMLAPALDYIQKNYPTDISLDDLSEACLISTSHFIRLFKKYMSATPHDYLLQYRLRQAKHLLLASSDSIETIAELCGFNSASHFARAFKAANKITPTEFRQMEF